MLAFIPEAASREYPVPLPKSRPGQRKRTRNLCDRFGIQDQDRERLLLTLLTDSLGTQPTDTRKFDCRQMSTTPFGCATWLVMAA